MPQEGFNLYAEISAITLNFQVLLSTSAMLAFMYLVILKYYGLLQIQWKRVALHSSFAALFLLAATLIGKASGPKTDNYHNLFSQLSMGKAIVQPPPVTIFRTRDPYPPPTIARTLARILERGILRVGYDTRNAPFCYLNERGEVVGYDIAYAYQLAKDLDVKLELIPFDDTTLIADLNSGYYDIAMSAVLMDEDRIRELQFSSSYIEQPNTLIVKNSRHFLFPNLIAATSNPSIELGAIGGYQRVAHIHFPKATTTPLHTMDQFLHANLDAVMWSEIPAYVWCLSHPDYTAVSFGDGLGKKFFAYPCAGDTELFIHFLNDWLALKNEQGFARSQAQYWFLGSKRPAKNERWSVVRNVLHWVD